jgi:hypothetical protein
MLIPALAGCEYAPHPLTLSRDSVTIQYDPVLYSAQDAWPEARSACARYNRVPVLQLERGFGTRYMTFDCVSPNQWVKDASDGTACAIRCAARRRRRWRSTRSVTPAAASGRQDARTLKQRVDALQKTDPTLSWDQALDHLIDAEA